MTPAVRDTTVTRWPRARPPPELAAMLLGVAYVVTIASFTGHGRPWIPLSYDLGGCAILVGSNTLPAAGY
jgi:hypothetical protein